MSYKLPYKKLWRMVDRVISLDESSIEAEKLITESDFHLQGHFPNSSIYPGMLLVEGIRQLAEQWMLERLGDAMARYHLERLEARFVTPAKPGDRIGYNVTIRHPAGQKEFKIVGVNRRNQGTVLVGKLVFRMDQR